MTTSQNAQTGPHEQQEAGPQGAGEHPAGRAPVVRRGRRLSARASATRAAREAKMARDERAAQKEAQIESALADFYQAKGTREEIMARADERAQQIIEAAKERSGVCVQDMHAAVARLHELGETAVSLRELTGLGPVALREILETHTDGSRLSGPRQRRQTTTPSTSTPDSNPRPGTTAGSATATQ